MSRSNVRNSVPSPVTHEGGRAARINAELQLRRSVMSCLLWEDSFYESGESIATRIEGLIPKVSPEIVASIAVEAREAMKLRHVPLKVVREMAKHDTHKGFVAATLERVIQRADELSEFLSIYWRDSKGKQVKTPIASQIKKGLARAFQKFDAYALAKYDKQNAVKLRDVLFLTHAKPKDAAQAEVWKKLVDGTLEAPDTWEVELSSGKGENKKESWTRLLTEGKLGALALLRNLRNMEDAGVDRALVKKAISELKTERVLPFRFISAARYAPQLESALETPMLKCLQGQEKMSGNTVLLVDVSGSMEDKVSGKSEISRLDAACGLGILLREICENVDIYTFSSALATVPARRGFALRDAIVESQPHGGTHLAGALTTLHAKKNSKYDRIIVITDEQSHDGIVAPKGKGYVVNVASYQNGVGYGKWTHVDGWSESIVTYIRELEKLEASER